MLANLRIQDIPDQSAVSTILRLHWIRRGGDAIHK